MSKKRGTSTAPIVLGIVGGAWICPLLCVPACVLVRLQIVRR